MSGIAEHNFPAFNEAAAKLRALGHEIVNPAENPLQKWEDCLKLDIKQLCDCDTIIMLPGWELSKGAHLELHVAHRVGITIKYLSEFE